MSKTIQFTDRYQALGIPHPKQETACLGQCEGTGWVPVRGLADDTGLLLQSNSSEDPRLVKAWEEAHRDWCLSPVWPRLKRILKTSWKHRDVKWLWHGWEACDGWHFVKCPDCGGSGLKESA